MGAKIKDMSIVTNEIRMKNYLMNGGDFSFNPVLQKKTGKIDNKENQYFIELTIEINNDKEHPFPIDLYAQIMGIFTIENGTQEEINEFLRIQAVQMVFPYLRALVSNITASSMMNPLVLPIINATCFKDTQNK